MTTGAAVMDERRKGAAEFATMLQQHTNDNRKQSQEMRETLHNQDMRLSKLEDGHVELKDTLVELRTHQVKAEEKRNNQHIEVMTGIATLSAMAETSKNQRDTLFSLAADQAKELAIQGTYIEGHTKDIDEIKQRQVSKPATTTTATNAGVTEKGFRFLMSNNGLTMITFLIVAAVVLGVWGKD